jgi:hypothetical protein
MSASWGMASCALVCLGLKAVCDCALCPLFRPASKQCAVCSVVPMHCMFQVYHVLASPRPRLTLSGSRTPPPSLLPFPRVPNKSLLVWDLWVSFEYVQAVASAQQLVAASGGVACVVDTILSVAAVVKMDGVDEDGVAGRLLYEAVHLGIALLLGNGAVVRARLFTLPLHPAFHVARAPPPLAHAFSRWCLGCIRSGKKPFRTTAAALGCGYCCSGSHHFVGCWCTRLPVRTPPDLCAWLAAGADRVLG